MKLPDLDTWSKDRKLHPDHTQLNVMYRLTSKTIKISDLPLKQHLTQYLSDNDIPKEPDSLPLDSNMFSNASNDGTLLKDTTKVSSSGCVIKVPKCLINIVRAFCSALQNLEGIFRMDQPERLSQTIIFTRSYQDCTNFYIHVTHQLGKYIAVPVDYPNLLKYCLLIICTLRHLEMR